MACFALVVVLSLICLFLPREFHLNQQESSSTVNETLDSGNPEDEPSYIDQVPTLVDN